MKHPQAEETVPRYIAEEAVRAWQVKCANYEARITELEAQLAQTTQQPAIPPDVRESIAYLIANSLDEYNVTLPETKRHVDAALAWLDQQEPTP